MNLKSLSRRLGALVCRLKGHHRYHFPFGCWDSNCAYACIRCGELDRPLEELVPVDTWEDEDWQRDRLDENELEAQFQLDCRWFQRLPFPRWL